MVARGKLHLLGQVQVVTRDETSFLNGWRLGSALAPVLVNIPARNADNWVFDFDPQFFFGQENLFRMIGLFNSKSRIDPQTLCVCGSKVAASTRFRTHRFRSGTRADTAQWRATLQGYCCIVLSIRWTEIPLPHRSS